MRLAEVCLTPLQSSAGLGDARAGSAKLRPVRRELERRIVSLQRLRPFALDCESVAKVLERICPMGSKASSLIQLVLSTAYAPSVEQ